MSFCETTEQVYLFVRSYMLVNDGRPPSLREIGEGVRPGNALSSSVVDFHLGRLESVGFIVRVPVRDNGNRVIQLPGAHFVAPPMPVMR